MSRFQALAARAITPERLQQLKHVGLRALQVVGVLIAVLAVVVGSVMVVARTDWGSERLRRLVVSRANQTIRGQVGIARLKFGGDRLIVWDVTLRDPDGQLCAQVARVEVDFRVWPLLRKLVRITEVRIEGPHLTAVSGPRGLNLTRATEPRKKTNPKAPSPPTTLQAKEGWVLQLERFELTEGDVVVASTTPTTRKETAHLATLHIATAVRYATGNGALDLRFRLDGKSVRAPEGPLTLAADVHRHADATHLAVDGALLGGTIRARGDLVGSRLDAASATGAVTVSLPRTPIAGFEWGPVHLDAAAQPGAAPRLDLLIAIPGLQLTARTTRPAAGVAPTGAESVELEARLALADLALTGVAAQGLAAGLLPTLAGQGDLSVSIDGARAAGGVGSWSARCKGKGLFDRLRVGDTFVTGLTLEGHSSQLTATPDEAALRLAVASLTAGATKLTKVQLDLTARQRTLALAASIDGPESVQLGVDGRIDDDRRGLTLTRIGLGYPKAKWVSAGTTRLRFDGDVTSLRGLHLDGDGGQVLTLDGSKAATRVDAQLAVKLRLDLLPALVLDPGLGAGGTLGVDVKASGETAAPRVVAQVRLEEGRFRKLSKIRAHVDATLADQRVDGTLGVEAPFATVDGAYGLPLDLLDEPSSTVDVKVNASRVDLGDALRGAGVNAGIAMDGKLASRLRVHGTAADPRVELTIDGRELEARLPPTAASAAAGKPTTVDVGRAQIRLVYEDRLAHANVDFDSAHGGSLRVDASTRVDLSYPAVTQPIAVKRLPVHGKVVARSFDVSWIAPFQEHIESLGGQVSADTRLGGTIGDPQFLGDVHWKNGQVVTTAADVPPGAHDGKPKPGSAGSAGRTGAGSVAGPSGSGGRGGAGRAR